MKLPTVCHLVVVGLVTRVVLAGNETDLTHDTVAVVPASGNAIQSWCSRIVQGARQGLRKSGFFRKGSIEKILHLKHVVKDIIRVFCYSSRTCNATWYFVLQMDASKSGMKQGNALDMVNAAITFAVL